MESLSPNLQFDTSFDEFDQICHGLWSQKEWGQGKQPRCGSANLVKFIPEVAFLKGCS